MWMWHCLKAAMGAGIVATMGLLPGAASAAGCLPIAGLDRPVRPVAFHPAAVPAGASLQLTFLGHSSFLIETAGGVTVVTDYNGYVRPPVLPDIVTMNNAHSTHFTPAPDPAIPHVLRGWNPEGGWAQHDLTLDDLRVRSIPTAVHGRAGDQALSNSIFVFETPDICIAHLGHLHHVPTSEQVAELGQIDILLVPIDGAYTMSQPLMVQAITRIGPALVVPMHYFGRTVLDRFLALMPGWEIVMSDRPSAAFSRTNLPYHQVLILPGN